MSYKVKFMNPEMPGKGFIDGYKTARRAKAVAAAYNAQFAKDGNKGIRAEYLGRDRWDDTEVSAGYLLGHFARV